jgi:Cu+-exporting ATPase
VDETQVLRLAGALEHASEHPIAKAIAAAAAARIGDLPRVDDFTNLDGLGVSGVVDSRAVLAGRPRLLSDRGHETPPALTAAIDDAQVQGRTAVVVGWDGAVRAVLVVADTVKPPAPRRCASYATSA